MNKKNFTHAIPAAMPKSFSDLEQELALVHDLYRSTGNAWAQIDVVDGIYAPNKTWPYVNDEAGMFTRIVKQEDGLPHWEDLSFEVDLMVIDPARDADRWIAAGASRVIVHVDSISFDAFLPLAKNVQDKGVELVLGIGLDTPIDKIRQYAEAAGPVDGFQCMGIRKIGFQGQPFDAAVLQKIAEVRGSFPDAVIAVDGGVDLDTARSLIDAGASRLVCGSALLQADSPLAFVEEIESMF